MGPGWGRRWMALCCWTGVETTVSLTSLAQEKRNMSSSSKWVSWCYQAVPCAAWVSRAQRVLWFRCPWRPWTRVFLPPGLVARGDTEKERGSGYEWACWTADLLVVVTVSAIACENPTLWTTGKMGQVLTWVTKSKKLFLMEVSDSLSVETSIAPLSPPLYCRWALYEKERMHSDSEFSKSASNWLMMSQLLWSHLKTSRYFYGVCTIQIFKGYVT